MIERYTRPEMGAIWGDEGKIARWLTVELAVCEAWSRRGRIPTEAMDRLRTATCDLPRMREIEQEVDHDMIAFVRAVGESVGEVRRFLHLGLTSSDVVDTALALQLRDATGLIDAALAGLTQAVAAQAVAHRRTVMIGRTHGVHAEPTTFGLKLAVWYDELRRQRRRLALAREDIAVGKLSGAVGTHAHVPPELEDEVCAELGLAVAPASTQIVQRDRHAFLLGVLAGIAGTVEKMATEIRHLQRTEVGEAEEPFDAGNMGSSAMPHKRNPHASERLCGLARVVRAYAVTAAENQALWHERDISHSSAERVILPDSCIALDFMLAEASDIVKRLVVYPDRMRSNLELTGGAIFSQSVLLALVDAGMDRQDAYRLVQRHATASWASHGSFWTAVSADETVRRLIEPERLAEIFEPDRQLLYVDAVFARLGLGDDVRGPNEAEPV
ncbi:MAG: Adenylosuccinate lyase @ SAICAR lyase [uncultured Thermomicrobiales bacterium]|uniref:Adenylosuccinate lyase n=1 Tax=uncultured Thermomicrobiales bacterium TaxID=1645740 RepID=A0A6J4USR8_9BACT|nr:MAG: Adenylosuccinate lyase @ SAICAR lyase [uncultured Thermomicrobiales bacterium]